MATVWLKREDCQRGTLPKVCLRCGKPTEEWVEKDFVGTLFWIRMFWWYLGDEVGWPARVPMCRKHRHHWRNRLLGLWSAVLLFALLIAVVGLGHLSDPFPGASGFRWTDLSFLLVGPSGVALTLLFVVYSMTGIRAIEFRDEGIRLTGVSMEFAQRYDPPLQDLAPSATDRWGKTNAEQLGRERYRGDGG